MTKPFVPRPRCLLAPLLMCPNAKKTCGGAPLSSRHTGCFGPASRLTNGAVSPRIRCTTARLWGSASQPPPAIALEARRRSRRRLARPPRGPQTVARLCPQTVVPCPPELSCVVVQAAGGLAGRASGAARTWAPARAVAPAAGWAHLAACACAPPLCAIPQAGLHAASGQWRSRGKGEGCEGGPKQPAVWCCGHTGGANGCCCKRQHTLPGAVARTVQVARWNGSTEWLDGTKRYHMTPPHGSNASRIA